MSAVPVAGVPGIMAQNSLAGMCKLQIRSLSTVLVQAINICVWICLSMCVRFTVHLCVCVCVRACVRLCVWPGFLEYVSAVLCAWRSAGKMLRYESLLWFYLAVTLCSPSEQNRDGKHRQESPSPQHHQHSSNSLTTTQTVCMSVSQLLFTAVTQQVHFYTQGSETVGL